MFPLALDNTILDCLTGVENKMTELIKMLIPSAVSENMSEVSASTHDR